MSMNYSVEAFPDKDLALLRISGTLDFGARPEFRKAVEELLVFEQARYVIDLKRVVSMTSLYFGSLIDIAGRCKQNERSLTVMLAPQLARVARMAGLDSVVQLVEVKS